MHLKKLLLTPVLLLLSYAAFATHLVGGYISYRYISGTTYEIKLYIYRDCTATTPFDGTPNSNGPAFLGIYDANGNNVDVIELYNPVITSIPIPSNNPCLVPNGNVCVEEGVYTYNYTFPSGVQAYTLVHVRCCRNGSIDNLINPGDQGTTYSAIVPPTNSYRNNSPVFTNFPPIFICVNAPLTFNHSATDADGDQLIYSLCTPRSGGDPTFPSPNPPPGPPFTPITWQPPYTTNNPLGGVALNINPQSGVLTGTPNAIGQYVVGICVSEYRNGVLIDSYIRDFQFNVVQCNNPVANVPSTNINPVTGIGVFTVECNGLTVNFNNTSYNPPPTNVPLTYSWDFGVPSISTDTSSAAVPTYTYSDTGTYLVRLIAQKGTGASGCSDTTYAYVKLYPVFNTDFSTANVCQFSQAAFTDLTSSTVNTTINNWSWSFGDGTSSTQQNPTHAYTSPGTYNVRLISSDQRGCVDSAIRTITIYPKPTATFTTGSTCINTPVVFSNSSTGNISTYNWNLGTTTSTLQTPAVIYTATGNVNISLVVTSPDGCKDTSAQTITIHPLPVVNISNDTTICPFTSAQLNASGGNSYTWTPAADLSNANISNPVATPTTTSTITYTVRVVDQNQCANADSVRISFFPVPNIDAGIDTSVCLNPGSFRDSVRLNATGGVSYIWSPATGLSTTVGPNPVSRPPTNTTYYVVGTDANGCRLTDSVRVYFLDPSLDLILETSVAICERDTARANVLNQGASSYLWTPNQYLTNPTSWSTGFFPPDTTKYILTVANYCYQKSDSVLIIVHPLPIVATNPIDSICNNDSIQLNANNGQVYAWSPSSSLNDSTLANPIASPNTTTLYTVVATDSFGCSNRDSTLILVYFPSIINVTPRDTAFICQGSGVRLSVTGASTYLWQNDPSLSPLNVANPFANPTDTTWYFVEATNIHGCKTYDSVLIRVQLPVTAYTESPFEACYGVPLKLFASGGFYYLWSPSTGLNNANIDQPFATPDSTIFYIVQVSNDCFSDTAIAEVIVHPLPFVDAGNDTLIWRDTYATLNGLTYVSNYFWNPSTWMDDPLQLSSRVFPPKTQWYELFAYDEYGCLNKDSVLVTVEPYTILDLPTAFSPNGDGLNDVFRIVRWLNIDKLTEFAVYNRWGQKVFSTNNIEQGWDGRLNGREQDMGVFVWMIEALTKDAETILKKGNVTLVR
jgi:gliding motility-associated-like protein